MKNIYRILSLALALLFVLPVLAACDGGNGGEPADDTTVTTAATDVPVTPAASVSVVENGKPKFAVVRGESADKNEIEAAKNIWKYFCGLFPNDTIDFVDDFKTYDENAVAIVVGKTTYPETREVLSDISYGEYAIRVVNNKIVITAWQGLALTVGWEELTKLVGKKLSADKSTLTLTSDDNITKTFQKSLTSVPAFDGKDPTAIVSCGDSAYQVLISGAAKEAYDAYIAKLKTAGFETVSEREVSNNFFFTGKTETNAVTAYYISGGKTVRIIVEPIANLPVSDPSDAKVTTPKLTMIGRRFSTTDTYLGQDAGAGLMCFMIRLSDGRFVVIDGGNASGGYGQALYQKMLEQAPDPQNIVIAAWIITHSHSDHIGGFNAFTDTYDKVKVERIIYNFPSDADSNASNDGKGDYNAFGSRVNVQKARGAAVYKVHTGQVLTYGDARFEFYYTHEDYVTGSRTIQSTKNWNNTSLIFSCDIAGERIMFLGDAQEDPNNQTAGIFGSYLKSDMVQIAHHGGIGGTKAIYKEIDPEIAFFTTTDALVPVYITTFDYNNYLINALHVKEYYNACDRIYEWDLPYHAASSGFIK